MSQTTSKGASALAALYVTQRREPTRSFDTCFEMDDGDAVAVALWRRAWRNPESTLARNLPAYIREDGVHGFSQIKNLTAWARELRLKAQRRT